MLQYSLNYVVRFIVMLLLLWCVCVHVQLLLGLQASCRSRRCSPCVSFVSVFSITVIVVVVLLIIILLALVCLSFLFICGLA